jgi:AraC-like DNA-binding protein
MAQQSRTISAFDQALRLIHQRACDGSSIEQILDSIHVSRQTLERHFQTHLGCTPGQELVRVRIEQAKALLAMTHHPIKRIARMVGFSTASSFSAFFRHQTGISPTTFRKASYAIETPGVPITQAARPASPRKRALKLNNAARCCNGDSDFICPSLFWGHTL